MAFSLTVVTLVGLDVKDLGGGITAATLVLRALRAFRRRSRTIRVADR